MPPRVGANAAIVRDGRILLIEFVDGSGLHYNLPGGGVDDGESLRAAAMREAREEACASIEVGRLLLAWEYFPTEDHADYGTRHKVTFVFAASLTGGSEPSMPEAPDPNQTGVRWIALEDLVHVPLLPPIADALLCALRSPEAATAFVEV